MARAALGIRSDPAYRRDAFAAGLQRLGYQIHGNLHSAPVRDDVLVTWNRYGRYDAAARAFEAVGARVIVAENGYLGREWRGEHWYSLALGQHNGAGRWPAGDFARWDTFGARLAPWRVGGDELVVLQTRGIGPDGIREPQGWSGKLMRELAPHLAPRAITVRLRCHPGETGLGPALEADLARAWAVATWGSGGALKALMAGVPVFHGFPCWIGAASARALYLGRELEPLRDDALRVAMFRRLAWAMWRVEEIATGAPFKGLLCLP